MDFHKAGILTVGAFGLLAPTIGNILDASSWEQEVGPADSRRKLKPEAEFWLSDSAVNEYIGTRYSDSVEQARLAAKRLGIEAVHPLDPEFVPQVPLAEPNPGPPKLTKLKQLRDKVAAAKGVKLSVNQASQLANALQRRKQLASAKSEKQMGARFVPPAQVPIVVNSPDSGMIRIKHREYITDVVTPGSAFNLSSYPINPGVPSSFPWLSQLAVMFDRYRCHSLRYMYRATSANALNSTATALGVVVLTTQYDPYDPAFLNKIQMETNAGTVSTAPSMSVVHTVAAKRAELQYVRGVSYSGDLRMSDIGTFVVATQGQQAGNNTLGEIWVEYDFEFHQPKVPTGVDSGGDIAAFTSVPTTSDAVASFSNRYAAYIGVSKPSANNMTLTNVTPGSIYYIVTVGTAATTLTWNSYITNADSTCAIANVLSSAGVANATNRVVINSTALFTQVSAIKALATTINIQIAAPSVVTGAAWCDWFVFGGVSSTVSHQDPLSILTARLALLESSIPKPTIMPDTSTSCSSSQSTDAVVLPQSIADRLRLLGIQ